MSDGLVLNVLSSVMVAEERITTKFSSEDKLRQFALFGMTRRLEIIGVPIESVGG